MHTTDRIPFEVVVRTPAMTYRWRRHGPSEDTVREIAAYDATEVFGQRAEILSVREIGFQAEENRARAHLAGLGDHTAHGWS